MSSKAKDHFPSNFRFEEEGRGILLRLRLEDTDDGTDESELGVFATDGCDGVLGRIG